MSKFNLCGLMLLAAITLTASASDKPITPVGVYQIVVDQDDETEAVLATIERDGEKGIPIETGMAVYPDDKVTTKVGGGVAVAYTEGFTVTLQESTQLTVGAGGTGIFQAPSFILNSGHAALVASSRNTGFEFGIGDSRAPVARASTAVKLDLIVTKDAAGNFITNVGVLNGTITLTPVPGTSSVNVTTGTQAIMTINTATNPPSGAVNKGNLGKDQLKSLKGVNFTETLVSQGKSGFAFKSTIKNGDGSISKGSVSTNLTGGLIKDSWKTANKGDKSSASFAQDVTKGKLAVKVAFGGNSFSASFTGNTASKAALKTSTKQSYKGTATYNPTNGLITFTTTTPSKDGTTATFTYDPRDPAKQTQTIVVTSTAGVAGTPIVHTIVTGPPPANIPVGNLIEQNMPPKSQ